MSLFDVLRLLIVFFAVETCGYLIIRFRKRGNWQIISAMIGWVWLGIFYIANAIFRFDVDTRTLYALTGLAMVGLGNFINHIFFYLAGRNE